MIQCKGSQAVSGLLIVGGLVPWGQAQGVRAADGKPSVVKVVEANGAFRLVRNGAPYLIKGGGGDGSKKLLYDSGGNSFRTWGADDLGAQLDEAQRLGLTVTVGIWLGHKEHGFDYNNADQVAAQFEMAKKAILRYKDHPAVLMWGIGNEMEAADNGANAAVWLAVNNIAAMAKRLDPNHPTMTVVAEIGGNKVKNINGLCPDIDVIGINSYGGGASIPMRYKAAGGVKPYVLTEFGPPGVWETGKNDFGATPELSSTAKAALYRKTWDSAIAGQNLALGGYAFAWGHKQEATATWFGILLPDGSKLGAVDALTEAWTGKRPANRCPELKSLKVEGSDQVEAGATVKASLDATDPDGDSLKVDWVLQSDNARMNTNGDRENAPPTYADAIVHGSNTGVEVHMPKVGGIYRLFAYVHDNHNGAAVANVPLFVKGGSVAPIASGKPAALPFTVYAEAVSPGTQVFIPSGYMGNTGAIKANESYTVNPHSGKTCMQWQYTAKDNWGGVVWQSPANDWGDQAGGKNLTGATKLTFWARGERGGEVVTFLCGVINRDKPFYDTVQTKLDRVALTTDWKQYTIDLKGKDLSRIKTGFGWTLAADDQPVTFYLDDIKYE
ncbi:MAG: beta-D-glucuronidase [Chthonomonadaceae bacterium]|nr:beta-D-glucuronidase [Chthonomonadaceae bacterium]